MEEEYEYEELATETEYYEEFYDEINPVSLTLNPKPSNPKP